ncbi:ACP S-malonyltransferase [uncultured Thiothrix sp.]|uniref:ACP S-malonyltransferase n=1 Tax=uncultured Thiothrix sp. TaxID=223185 RepID=UPI002605F903|nr:ACP S-malonyltransferase [uncultured Thiothrix sp.]
MAIAGLFPGQGSQSLGMLAELAASFPIVKQTFEQASTVLGRDLWQLAQEGDESALNSTETTQPLMLAAGVAVWRVWQTQGGCLPVAVAGHSLGEYSALVAAEVLDFTEAVALVSKRAQLMQAAVPEGTGAMAAILGLTDEQVMTACEQAAQGEIVEAVNFNSPEQVVIAGNAAAIERAIEIANQLGAKKTVKLAVSVPSHCSLMKPAAAQLEQSLSQTNFGAGQLTVLQNVDGLAREDAAGIRSALAEQLYLPVRWVTTIRNLQVQQGAKVMLEFGPGKVLTGLNRRIERRMDAICINDNPSLEAALKFCQGA